MKIVKRKIFQLILLSLFLIFSSKFSISQIALIDPSQPRETNTLPLVQKSIKTEYQKNDLSCHNDNKNLQDSKKLKLEAYYSNRANQDLRLQGYDIVGGFGVYNDSSFPSSGVQDDYIIGPGDEFILVLQGATTEIINKKVSREGLLIYDFTEPISATGRPFYEIKDEIQTRVDSSLVRTSAYVSLGKLKQVRLSIAGEVNCPGQYHIMGNSTLIDVLSLTGGFKKGGSLRNIQLLSNGKVTIIDLYPYLYGGTAEELSFYNFNLSNGSIIVVPTVTETVAIAGNYMNPGIYEINKNKTNLNDIFNSFGSFESPGKVQTNINTLYKGEIEQNISNVKKNYEVKNGDIIFSYLKTDYLNKVNVYGEFPSTKFNIDKTNKLSQFIDDNINLSRELYRLSVVIKSIDKTSLRSYYRLANLYNVLNNKTDIELNSGDDLFFLNMSDLKFLLSSEINQIINQEKLIVQKSFSCEATRIFDQKFRNQSEFKKSKYRELVNNSTSNDENALSETENINLVINQSLLANPENTKDQKADELLTNKTDCPEIFIQDPNLLSFLIDKIILIQGDIEAPGVYLISEDIDLKTILNFAGYSKGEIKTFSGSNKVIIEQETINVIIDSENSRDFVLDNKKYLSDLLKDNDFINDKIYPLFGIIQRNNINMAKFENITFNLTDVLSGNKDYLIYNKDQIKLFTKKNILRISQNYGNNAIFNNNIVQTDLPNDDKPEVSEKINSEILSLSSQSQLKSDIINTMDNTSNNQSTLSNKENNKDLDKISNTFDNISLEIDQAKRKIPILFDSLVKVYGSVVSPGFYPLGAETNLENIINVAQGISVDGNYEKIEVSNIINPSKIGKLVRKGAEVFVPSRFQKKNYIKFNGSIENPRLIPFLPNQFISELVYSKNLFNENAYLNFAIIKRLKGNNNNTKVIIPFSPAKVIDGKQNIKLSQGDEIYFFTESEVDQLIKTYATPDTILSPEIITDGEFRTSQAGTLDELVRRFLISIEGEVTNPKKILLAGKYNLKEVIGLAGGFTYSADKSRIELLFPYLKENQELGIDSLVMNYLLEDTSTMIVQFGSSITVAKKQSEFGFGEVKIGGQINQPGNYRIKKNESIFDLLVRVGGLNKNAYMDGFSLTRVEEKKREEESIKRLLRELDKAIAVAVETQREVNPVSGEDIQMLRDLAVRATDYKPVGRLVGDFSNISVLKKTFLNSGDEIFIPKRPTSVTVVGEVMTPGSTLWNKSLSVNQYIQNSAGFTELADNKKIFIINPNGTAKKNDSFWGKNTEVKPGSIIVIPRRIELASTLGKISAITSVIYQLTLTIAGIDNILNN